MFAGCGEENKGRAGGRRGGGEKRIEKTKKNSKGSQQIDTNDPDAHAIVEFHRSAPVLFALAL